MRFELSISTGNAAVVNELFGGNGTEVEIDNIELATMLHKVAQHLVDGYRRGVVRDSNGNGVGTWQITSK